MSFFALKRKMPENENFRHFSFKPVLVQTMQRIFFKNPELFKIQGL